jgi:hypothetical protein
MNFSKCFYSKTACVLAAISLNGEPTKEQGNLGLYVLTTIMQLVGYAHFCAMIVTWL